MLFGLFLILLSSHVSSRTMTVWTSSRGDAPVQVILTPQRTVAKACLPSCLALHSTTATLVSQHSFHIDASQKMNQLCCNKHLKGPGHLLACFGTKACSYIWGQTLIWLIIVIMWHKVTVGNTNLGSVWSNWSTPSTWYLYECIDVFIFCWKTP